MSTITEPFKGVVLVEFPEGLPTVIKDHDSLTLGKVVALNSDDPDNSYLLGSTVYWRKYRDDARIDNQHAFIEVKDLLGRTYEDTLSNNG